MGEKLSEEDVRSRVEEALDVLLKKDSYLLEVDANERSITHKLAEYLQQEFPEYEVDCEYNRNISDKDDGKKRIETWQRQNKKTTTFDNTEAKTVYPDIIVHKRGAVDNLLIIEVKKALRDKKGKKRLDSDGLGTKYAATPEKIGDIDKLKKYKEDIGYEHILFIELWVNSKKSESKYTDLIENGEKPYELYFNNDILK